LDSENIHAKAGRIKLVVTDIDGVWTDARMFYSASGEAMKSFSTYDGMATYLLKLAKIPVAIITGENSPIVAARAEKLKIEDVHLGIEDKLGVLEGLMEKYALKADEVAYIGDDVNDYSCMQVAGLTACPANSPVFHLLQADILLERRGGEGAFREFADIIIAAQE